MSRGAEFFETQSPLYPESWLNKVNIPGYTDPESLLPLLFQTELETVRSYYFRLLEEKGMSPEDIAKVKKAYDFAAKVYEVEKYKLRKSKDHILTHPLGVAISLIELEGILDVNVHQAAMLHDLIEDTKLGIENADELIKEKGNDYFHQEKLNQLRKEGFEPEVIEIVETVTNIKSDRLSQLDVFVLQYLKDNSDLDFDQITQEQLEASATEIKIQYALEKNVLGTILKTAGDAVHNAITADFHFTPKKPDKVEQVINRSRENHATLADALGLYRAAEVIKNNYLRLMHPQDYERLLFAFASFNRHHFRDQILAELSDKMLHLTGMHLDFQQLILPAAGLLEVYEKQSAEPDILPQTLYPKAEIWCQNKGQYLMWLNFFNLLEGIDTLDTSDLNAASVRRKLIYSYYGQENLLEIILINDEKRFEYLAKPADYYRRGVEGLQLIKAEAAMARLISEYRSTLEQNLDNPVIAAQQLAYEVQKPQISVFTPQGIERYVEKGSTALDYARTIHAKLFARSASCQIDRNGKIIVGDLDIILEPGDIVTIYDIHGKPVVLDKDKPIREEDFVLLPQKLEWTKRENEIKRIIKLIRRFESNPLVRKDAEKRGAEILNEIHWRLFGENVASRPEKLTAIKPGMQLGLNVKSFLESVGFSASIRQELAKIFDENQQEQIITTDTNQVFSEDSLAKKTIKLAQLLHQYWHSRHNLELVIENQAYVIEYLGYLFKLAGVDVLFSSGSITSRDIEGIDPIQIDITFMKGDENQVDLIINGLNEKYGEEIKITWKKPDNQPI
jgi:(p)ppGpp synthase/HD superfamily hydrolase